MTILDVSFHQGAIDWARVAAADHVAWPGGRDPEVVGAIVKLGGAEIDRHFQDSRFLANLHGVRAAGLKAGAYWFMDGGAGSSSGKAEAEYFLNAIAAAGGLKPGDLRPALDVEWPPTSGALFQIEQLGEAVEFLRQRLGAYPIVYTGRWYWDEIIDAAEFEELAEDENGQPTRCPLWIAGYVPQCPPVPRPWRSAALWQFTDKARVDGIAGPVDANRLLVPIEQLVLS